MFQECMCIIVDISHLRESDDKIYLPALAMVKHCRTKINLAFKGVYITPYFLKKK